jgi:hypothetical protein
VVSSHAACKTDTGDSKYTIQTASMVVLVAPTTTTPTLIITNLILFLYIHGGWI